jgi:hypothetical protein
MCPDLPTECRSPFDQDNRQWYCGYVGIDKKHPLYEVDYMDKHEGRSITNKRTCCHHANTLEKEEYLAENNKIYLIERGYSND